MKLKQKMGTRKSLIDLISQNITICVFTNGYNPRAFIEKKDKFRPTLVKRGATIGANATIICDNTIGRYAMVVAGAVVTSDVPEHALIMGVPATQIGWVCQCGTTLQFSNDRARCDACMKEYRVEKGKIKAIK